MKQSRTFYLHSVIVVLIFSSFLSINAQVTISEQNWTIPTYNVNAPDKNPMFFRNESYQGASKYIYPYAMNDAIGNEKANHDWKALILENEYIKLCVTPEIGGKLYYATDKTNNYNFVYKNDVVKPSNIGMLGAWVSGGIEWCVIHHHRASTFLPVDYDFVENNDGSKTIFIGETEPRHRMRWTVGITAYPGKSYFSADVRIINPTPFTNSFLYWANVAAHTDKDYQVIFPPSVQIATYHAKNSFTHWPYSTDLYNGEDFTGGVDISWWKNSVHQDSYFAYDLKEDFMGGYDHGKESGTVHIGDHNIVKGAKLWEWGSGEAGQATEARLTESAGPYVEIMVGAFSDNQPDYSWIKPYEVKTFRQYWYPVKGIQGFKYANLNGAVNFEKRGNELFLGYYSTQKIEKAKIVVRKGSDILYEKETEISPAAAFTQTIKPAGVVEMTDLTTEFINTTNNEVLITYTPVNIKKTDKLPDIVKRPPQPSDIVTVEELYLTGSRILQFYNPTINAMDYFEEALKRDPSDIRTNTAVGNIYLRNGEYETARKYFVRAIRRLTKDYTRPSNCEALYLEGLTLEKLGLLDEAVDTLYRATWDYAFHSAAYLELSRISCLKGDFIKALDQVNKSLSINTDNNSAISLKSSILRRTGKPEAAEVLIGNLLRSDPLDFRTANELYLITKYRGDSNEADKQITGLNRKMRDFAQNYLELAVGYMNDGLFEEAEEVLCRYTGKNQELSYYLGYLEDKKGNREEAEKYFKEASDQPVDYGFPYRLETEKVLIKAVEYQKNNARPYYYLGNLLYDKQPGKAMAYWIIAVKFEPSLAIAWRNLGWGFYHFSKNMPSAIKAYETAISLKNDDPVYYAELDPLYEMNNIPVKTRASLFEGKNDVVKKRDDSFVREIIVLNLSGQYEKAAKYLDNSNFHFREGNSRVRDITVDAHIMLGKKNLEAKNYETALQHFMTVSQTKGKPGNDDRDPQINYFIGSAYDALGKKSNAKKYYTLAGDQTVDDNSFILYFKGLSLKKLGNNQKAEECFNQLIAEGEKEIQNKGSETDYFAKFGEKEAENVRMSNAFLLIGLGHKGLGNNSEAKKNLEKAVELSASNLYANEEIE